MKNTCIKYKQSIEDYIPHSGKTFNSIDRNIRFQRTAEHLPCEQRRAPSRKPSSGQRRADQSTWAKFGGVSSCRIGTMSSPGLAEGKQLSPPLPREKPNIKGNDEKEEKLTNRALISIYTIYNSVKLRRIKDTSTDLPGKKHQDVPIILRFVDLQHRLHSGLHIVRDWTEGKTKRQVRVYIHLVRLRLDHVCPLPDGVEDIHRESASFHCQNSTRVLAGVPRFIQVEEVMEFLQVEMILQLVRY